MGSRKNILHSSVIEIHELCMKHSIKLSIVWIPREVNDKADSLSRKIIDEHGQFRKFIIDHVYFQGDGLTKRGRGQNGILGLQNLKFRLLALRVHF